MALVSEVSLDAGNWLQGTPRFIIDEASSFRPGGETIITRLSDIPVIQAIRRWLDTVPEARGGWLAHYPTYNWVKH